GTNRLIANDRRLAGGRFMCSWRTDVSDSRQRPRPGRALAELARAAVTRSIGDGPWTLTSFGGSTRRTWLADGPREVVVKLDASAAVMRRVADLGVGPAVLASGRIARRSYVIQERIDAPAPSRGWLADHVSAVGGIFGAYQSDPSLAALADPLPATELARGLLDRVRSGPFTAHDASLAERLVSTVPTIDPEDAVATHGDPNSSNFLAAERLLLVDWDDLRRADPVRDLGPFAWWYIAEPMWPALFEAAGRSWSAAVRDRLFWWAAAESLDVAVRLRPHDQVAAEAFLADAAAAASHQLNPRRVD
ncbi:MAG TPA: phosphotransferase, partial [Methylomirabilota bacterium]|nr:phosphotransferase [Methylomirabilota bacterium]